MKFLLTGVERTTLLGSNPLNSSQYLFFYICIAEITTSDINQDYVSLLFKDPTTLKKYVVTAQADPRGNISIEAVVSYL